MSRLEVSGLWKGYRDTPVLQGVDLHVPAGSLTAVLGLSGCGKTTLLRVIAGFERAQRGRVSLADVTLDDGRTYVAPERRSIGYVPQEGALFPHLSVRENVGFGLSRQGRRGPAVSQLLDMAGIASLARRLPHELSGGEQQRVALARALARRPQALLLDEPFSALDASLRARLREEVHALLREQGVTTVLVTHDQEEALSLADSVAVLRDGRVIQQAAPTQLYGQPCDERLARFLGAVNMVDARVEGGLAHTSLGTLALLGGDDEETETVDASDLGGRRSLVMIRPEQLRVRARLSGVEEPTSGRSEEDPRAAAEHGVGGRVEQCRYYGHDALLRIRPERSSQAQPLLARVHGTQALPPGTPVIVSADGSAARLRGADERDAPAPG